MLTIIADAAAQPALRCFSVLPLEPIITWIGLPNASATQYPHKPKPHKQINNQIVKQKAIRQLFRIFRLRTFTI
jgi:hypothetical protein